MTAWLYGGRSLRRALARALLHRPARLLPASDSFRHHEHVLVAELDRLTGGLMARASMCVGAVEDQLPGLVLRQVGRLHGVEGHPLRAGDVALLPPVLAVVVEDVGVLRGNQ